MSFKISSHDLRRVSVRGHLDPRTIGAYLRGEVMRPLTIARVEDALRDEGLEHLVRATPRPVAASLPPSSGVDASARCERASEAPGA